MFGLGKSQSIKVVDRYVAALNARDSGKIAYLLADDVRFVDSHGEWIEGREQVIDATERFFAMEKNFHLDADSTIERNGEVLMQGSTRADDPSLRHDTLWKARVIKGKLAFWQSYGRAEAPHLTRILGRNMTGES